MHQPSAGFEVQKFPVHILCCARLGQPALNLGLGIFHPLTYWRALRTLDSLHVCKWRFSLLLCYICCCGGAGAVAVCVFVGGGFGGRRGERDRQTDREGWSNVGGAIITRGNIELNLEMPVKFTRPQDMLRVH